MSNTADLEDIPNIEDALFSARDVESGYGELQVLYGVDVDVEDGEIVLVFGPNGAGKSTFMRALYRQIPLWEGSIEMSGEDISDMETNDLVEYGITYVPQSNNVFPNLSVDENLELGGIYADDFDTRREDVYDLFPELEERKAQTAETLSGGERQMLAMARALVPNPDLLFIDEPTSGLAPQLIDRAFDHIERIRDSGTALLMVEQNVKPALEISDRGYVLDSGETRFEGTSKELQNSEQIRELYLGK